MFRSTEITRKQCGQIYLMSDDNFALICEYCEEEYYTLEDFRDHLNTHVQKTPVNIKIEDSISCDSELITPEKIANMPDNFIDILQSYVGTQSSASKHIEGSDSVKSDESNQSERNKVTPLKRSYALQLNSENESESTTETNRSHPVKHHKRLRKAPIIVHEEFQDENGTDYSSDRNIIEFHLQSDLEMADYEQLKSKKGTFGCRYCRKLFRSNRGRNDHENMHTGETPHKCLICHQSFARYAYFWTHSKTHTD